VVNKIAQAVIAEAEPHRRRFPNFACGRLVAITSPATAYTGRTPASGRLGEERDSAGDAALGMFAFCTAHQKYRGRVFRLPTLRERLSSRLFCHPESVRSDKKTAKAQANKLAGRG